jgi:hypothetical protein
VTVSKHNRDRRTQRAKRKAELGIKDEPPGTFRAGVTARYPESPKYADDNCPRPAQPVCYARDEPRAVKKKLQGNARALQAWLRFPYVYRGRG